MKNENIIEKITLNVGGVKVEVTPEQAKSLHDALEGLLGLNKAPVVTKEYVPYYPFTQPYWYTYPTWNSTTATATEFVTGCTVNYSSGNVDLTVQ